VIAARPGHRSACAALDTDEAQNSARVPASARNAPTMRLVIIDTPRLCTPRVVMHW
jgi:hypothetical protein